MSNWQFDSNGKGLMTVFKDYEVEELRFLWSLDRPGSSREVYDAVNKIRTISRASVINSLNRMVELEVLDYSEVTGKGGHRGLYRPKMDEKGLRKFVAAKVTDSIKANLLAS